MLLSLTENEQLLTRLPRSSHVSRKWLIISSLVLEKVISFIASWIDVANTSFSMQLCLIFCLVRRKIKYGARISAISNLRSSMFVSCVYTQIVGRCKILAGGLTWKIAFISLMFCQRRCLQKCPVAVITGTRFRSQIYLNVLILFVLAIVNVLWDMI